MGLEKLQKQEWYTFSLDMPPFTIANGEPYFLTEDGKLMKGSTILTADIEWRFTIHGRKTLPEYGRVIYGEVKI